MTNRTHGRRMSRRSILAAGAAGIGWMIVA
jgi:hypothetical protein